MKKTFLLGLLTMALPLATWAADKQLVVKAENFIYDGGATPTGIKVYVVGATGQATGAPLTDGYFVQYTYGENDTPIQTVRNAGKYTGTVYVDPNGQYKDYTVTYEGTEQSATFTVERKPVTVGLTLKDNQETTYNGQVVESNLELIKKIVDQTQINGLVDNSNTEIENFLQGLKLVSYGQSQIGPDAGDYGVEIQGDETATSNYIYRMPTSGSHVTLHINPIRLTVTLSSDYTGAEVTGTIIEGKGKNDIDNATTALQGVVATDADNFTIAFKKPSTTGTILNYNANGYPLDATAKLNGVETNNYEVTATYMIKKVGLTIAKGSKNMGINYGTAVPTDYTDYFTYTGLVTKDQTNGLPHADLKLVMKGDETEMETQNPYNLYPYVNGAKVVAANPQSGEKTYADALTNYTIIYTVETFSLWTKSLNDNVNFTYTPNATDENLRYQGKSFEVPENFVEVVFNRTGETLEYGKDYTLEAYKSNNAEIRDAGTVFAVKVKAAEGSKKFAGEYILPKTYTILQAPLTITQTDKELVKVQGSDDLDLYDGYFDFVGFVGEDKEAYEDGRLNELVSIYRTGKTTSEAVTGGENVPYWVAIYTNRLQAKNYDLGLATRGEGNDAYANLARLTILSPELVLDGAVEDDKIVKDLEVYNGLTVNKVIVKNLKSIRDKGILAENWYNLVLPFEVSVRDLSKAFGYAIVNVPNEDNTNPEVISYRLTMQTIPANVLMAFKVDKDMDWEEIGDEIVFEDKEIVAPTTWVTDGFHEYVGVYETEHISGPEYSFLWTDGGFWTASNGRDTDIYPLGGYFKTVEGPAPTRISFENPDGSTTAVSLVKTDAVNAAEGWYSIDGVKLNAQPTQKGVYINNGKKVVIK